MTKTTNGNSSDGLAPLMQSTADFQLLWDQTMAWISVHYLNIVIAGAIGMLILALLYGGRMMGARLCRREHLGHWPKIIGRAITKTNLFFMVMLSVRIVSGYASPPHALETTIHFLFVVSTAIQAAIWVRELIIGIVEHRAGGGEDEYSTLGSAIGIIRLLVTTICFAVAILLILDNLGVNTTGLIASLGVGGIAIGLAAQGIFSDLFAALSIIFDKPFRRGDTVKWDQTTGSVEAIGLKTTRVRATTGEEVVISNTNLLNKELRNLAHTVRRRATLSIGLIYQTSPEVCRRVPDIVKGIVNTQSKASLIHCVMINFGASSLDYELIFDVLDESPEVFNQVRHEICIGILETFAREGIEFAYPTQTTFTSAPDGTMVMPYPVVEKPTPVKRAPAKKG